MSRRTLSEQRVEARSGEARSALVLLHGYGANGKDLISLAEPLSEHLPDTIFLAPDAPEICQMSPMGLQWFPIPWIDGSSEEEAEAGLIRSAADIDGYLDGILGEFDFLSEQVALLGFSQGSMMSLHVAPRREEALAGVVGFSGRLLMPELLPDEVRSHFPVLLLHGNEDEVVPPHYMPEAVQGLEQANFRDVFAYEMKNTPHGISADGLGVALAFLRDKLSF